MRKPKSRNAKGSGAKSATKAVKPKRDRADNSTGTMLGGSGLAEVRRLIRLVQQTGIGELEVSAEGRTIRISAHSGGMVVSSVPAPLPAVAPSAAAPSKASVQEDKASDGYVAISSPMVGTFYRAPAPDADPYVEVGDRIEIGQTVCIIEAMKLMNEIEAEMKGRIVEILVENAQPVEFGQKLFLIAPE